MTALRALPQRPAAHIRRRAATDRRRSTGRPASSPPHRPLRRFVAAVLAFALASCLALTAYASVTPGPPGADVAAAPVQTLRVASDSTPITVDRDRVRTARIIPLPPGARPYAATADTFTNPVGAAIQWPFTRGVPISTGFGYRIAPCATCSSDHSGMDMNPGLGTPIQIITDGVVRETGDPNGELGVYAVIDHVVDGQRVSSLYAHMLPGSLQIKPGQRVQVTDLVGLVGSSGESTGPHLHFGILDAAGTPIDPYQWLKAHT